MKTLSIDYGEARTGLAISDYTGTIASPLTVLPERNINTLIEKIIYIAKENEVTQIVVGNPINMDGTKGEKSLKCEELADKLRDCSDVPVAVWDERLTTVSAQRIKNENRNAQLGVKSRRRRTASGGCPLDAVAAALILESYLTYKKNKALS